MAAEVKKEIELEIAHVLFLDIVGYNASGVRAGDQPAIRASRRWLILSPTVGPFLFTNHCLVTSGAFQRRRLAAQIIMAEQEYLL